MKIQTSEARRRSVARRLRKLRIRRGLTLEELSHRSGLSLATQSRLERAQREPTFEVVGRTLLALDASLDDSAWVLMRLAGFPPSACNRQAA